MRRRKERREGEDDGKKIEGIDGGRMRKDIEKIIGIVEKRMLKGIDWKRNVIKVKSEGLIERRREDKKGELREIVGKVKVNDRMIKVVVIEEIVKVRDMVVKREESRKVEVWNEEINEERRMIMKIEISNRDGELEEVEDKIRRRMVIRKMKVDLKKKS